MKRSHILLPVLLILTLMIAIYSPLPVQAANVLAKAQVGVEKGGGALAPVATFPKGTKKVSAYIEFKDPYEGTVRFKWLSIKSGKKTVLGSGKTTGDGLSYSIFVNMTNKSGFKSGQYAFQATWPGGSKTVNYTISTKSFKLNAVVKKPADGKTYDSSFELGEPYIGSNEIMAVCTKNGRETKDVYQFNGLSRKGYLRMGPGEYLVELWRPFKGDNFIRYKSFKITNYDKRSEAVVKYLLPEGDIQSDDSEIISLARSITSNCTSDMQKTGAIHDWVARNITYDTHTRFQGSLRDYNWDALEALHRRCTLCQGYANLTAALNRAIGLPAKVVRGDAIVTEVGETWADVGPDSKHAWNEVYVDGRWVIQDTTWDAGYIDAERKMYTSYYSSKYFCPDPAVFAKDHREDPTAN